MIKKLATFITIIGIPFILSGCTSQPSQNQVPIDQTSLAINLTQHAQLIPNLLVPIFTGIDLLKAYKIEPDQTCSIQKINFKSNLSGKIELAYIKTLQEFFPGFSIKDLSHKTLQCKNQNYNIYFATFVIPHTDQNYYFYQAIIPTNSTKVAFIISCESKQHSTVLEKIIYNVNCLKNE